MRGRDVFSNQNRENRFHRRNVSLGAAAAVWAVLLVSGCTTTPGAFPLGIWITDESAVVFPDTDRPASDGLRSELGDAIRLQAAVKEQVAFQMSLFADFGLVGRVDVSIGDLAGDGATISANDIEIFREMTAELAERPGWLLARSPRSRSRTEFYDPLLPVGHGAAAGMDVPARGNLTLWFDVTIPPGTPAGTYRSTMSVRVGAFRTQVPIEVVVEPFALPDRPDLTVLAGVDSRMLMTTHLGMDESNDLPQRWVPESPNYDKARTLLDDTLNLLRRHRCQPYVTDLYPVVKADAQNDPVVDWTSYDRMLSSFIEGGGYAERVPAQRWPLPINAAFPRPDRFRDADAPAYRAFLKAYTIACRAHFEEHGWEKIAFIALPPEADPQRGVDIYRRFAGLRDVFPDIVNPLPPASIRDFGWYDTPAFPAPTDTAIWAPSIRFASASMVRSVESAGVAVWLRAAEPPFGGGLSIGGWPTDARVFPWIARRWGVDTLWIDSVDDWPAALRKSRTAELPSNTERWLIYPGPPFGRDRPLPSLRLKRLRRGIQDVQYLDLLARNNRRQLADLAASCLVRFAGLDACTNHLSDAVHFGWEQSPAAWKMARQLAAEHIVRAVGGGAPSAGGDLATQLDWARLMEDTQRLRILVEGIRVEGVSATERGEAAVQARCHLLFMNDTRSAISGELTAGGVIDESAVANVTAPPGRRVGQRLNVAFTEAAGPSNTGLRPVSFRFELADGDSVNVTSRLAAIAPYQTHAPPKIDGRLDDWPLGLGNVASDFRLISSAGGETVEPDPPLDDRPTEATTAFVMADDKNLYIGIRAEESHMGDIVVRNNNFVRYDGMLPVGEDLVEVVIDPTNLGTTGPDEVYHLLVKANGAIITQRGVPTDPPVGACRPWQADATAAVKKQGDHWAAEIAVPLRAFSGAKPTGVWAINFARFHPRTAEYSNWAGVKGQIYNPRSMGNLVWPAGATDDDDDRAMRESASR